MISATVANFHEVGDAWKRYFNIASSHAVIALGDAVKTLYRKDPNVSFYKGLTPLHVAAATGKLLLLSIAYKIAIEKVPKDKEGFTPLHYSVNFLMSASIL